MSDEYPPPTTEPFDPAQLRVVDADTLPDEPEPITPDHTAGDGTESVIERVKRTAKSRSKTQPKPRKTKPRPRSTRPGELVEPLTQIYAAGGMALIPFDPACGGAVLQNAESCAKAVDELARQNDAVRRAVLAMMQTGAWGGVLMAHMPILAVVLMHHGPPALSESLAPYVDNNVPNAQEDMRVV